MPLITVNDFEMRKILTSTELNNFKNTVVNLLNGLLDSANLADAAVITAKIADLAVITAKIGDKQVTAAKLADGTITATNIADGTITNDKIADGTIECAKISTACLAVLQSTQYITHYDAANLYFSNNLDISLRDIAAWVGYDKYMNHLGTNCIYRGSALARPYTNGSYSYHATTYSGCSVTVLEDTAVNGLRVFFTAVVPSPGGGTSYLPLKINSTQLSSLGSLNPQFHVSTETQSDVDTHNLSGFVEITTANYPSLDLSTANAITFGQPFDSAGGNPVCTDFKLLVDTF